MVCVSGRDRAIKRKCGLFLLRGLRQRGDLCTKDCGNQSGVQCAGGVFSGVNNRCFSVVWSELGGTSELEFQLWRWSALLGVRSSGGSLWSCVEGEICRIGRACGSRGKEVRE